ncbi:MAG: DUF5026 domain-containing protein [Schwartzia sp.]|nr:DUF5026 domain-containing protein [Schwartzia sp. (in: firmicutes)]
MSVIQHRDEVCFDREQVHVRDFIRAQYHTWPEPRNGLIVSITDTVLTAIFLPAIHQSVCYFRVKAQEVEDGKWKLRYISFDDAWNSVVGGDDFADEYNPASAEDGADTVSAAHE